VGGGGGGGAHGFYSIYVLYFSCGEPAVLIS
jgi:hypothetical protein